MVRIVILLLSGLLMLGCTKDESDASGPDSSVRISGSRYIYNSPKPSSPKLLGMLGDSYVGLSSAAPGLPLWLGIRDFTPSFPSENNLVRLDTTGQVVLARHIYTGNLTSVIRATADGGCWIGGGDKLLRLRADGSVVWAHTLEYGYDFPQRVQINDLALRADGSVLLAGATRVDYGEQILLAHVSALGEVLWMREYKYPLNGTDPFEQPFTAQIISLPDNSFVIAGDRVVAPNTFLTRFSEIGQPLWSQTIAVPDFGTTFMAFHLLPDGSLQLGIPTISASFALLRFNIDGRLLFSNRYDGLRVSKGGITVSPQGETVLLGRGFKLYNFDGQGTFAGKLDAQAQPIGSLHSLEADTLGLLKDLPQVVAPGGNYVYGVGSLFSSSSIATTSITPNHFRLFKVDQRGGEVCSFTTDAATLTSAPLTPQITQGALPIVITGKSGHQDFTPNIIALPVVRVRNCGK
ncbi:hypothetical protein [Hymenobacter terrestris]|uniref:Uncharacterized protein n=1 Tax=Hymenobacter terrestris TaxID=2748310 RepID=A0ABX2Q6T5_9BACT|nr:hypothetical protein [Hymenobacter terrestris]NVO85467.1 hypothetical protein [Hymenobacter terrestris]